jgi:hypothetical protein
MSPKEKREQDAPTFLRWILNHIAAGRTRLVIKDNDTSAWESGFASFLMDHYNYYNLADRFVVFLNLPLNEGTRTPAECEKVHEVSQQVKQIRTSIF